MKPCKTCELVHRRDRGEAPLWDRIQRTQFWDIVHSYNTALPGWLVIVVRRHIEAIDELTEDEAVELGRLIRQVSMALREVTGCIKTYVMQFAENEDHRHVHFHIVPRMENQPEDRCSTQIFGYLNVPQAERVSEESMNELAAQLIASLPKCPLEDNMLDDVSDIAEEYNRNPEGEHARLERHQLEYDLTWRYLDQYLPPRGSILEVGAATGRYTLELVRRGYTLTAVDLSAGLIEKCRQNLVEAGLADQAQLVVADARDLSQVSGKQFDAVLLMGPLYHLIEETDRKLALQQAFDRLRPGGVLFSAFISRFGVLGGLIKNCPEWIEGQAEVRALIERGKRPDDFPRGGFRGYFAPLSEIVPLHAALGFETLVVAGVEPAISADDESYNKLEGKLRQLWLDLFFEISTEQSIIAASRHLLYIGKKPNEP